MRSLWFVWLGVVRQPARTSLGVLGIAAVGALLFDMLLLSRGLVVSFRDLLDSAGFDVRVVATDALPLTGPAIQAASRAAAAIAALPEVDAVVAVRLEDADLSSADRPRRHVAFLGADLRGRRPWTLVAGRDLAATSGDRVRQLLVNRNVATAFHLAPGSSMMLHSECGQDPDAPPPLEFRVVGIAEFPFDSAEQMTTATDLPNLRRACGYELDDQADLLLVASTSAVGPHSAAAAIQRVRPDLHVFTNEEIVDRFRRLDFSYFRQISAVLASVTLFFGFLLIAALLTVSVNQRLGEIAALRALGFSRRRVVAGVLCESALLVGVGGLLAVPLGLALSVWLDRILRAMPGIPVGVHFFVFETRVLVLHVVLLAFTTLGAAAYPMRLVARLPIAATLRREAIS